MVQGLFSVLDRTKWTKEQCANWSVKRLASIFLKIHKTFSFPLSFPFFFKKIYLFIYFNSEYFYSGHFFAYVSQKNRKMSLPPKFDLRILFFSSNERLRYNWILEVSGTVCASFVTVQGQQETLFSCSITRWDNSLTCSRKVYCIL